MDKDIIEFVLQSEEEQVIAGGSHQQDLFATPETSRTHRTSAASSSHQHQHHHQEQEEESSSKVKNQKRKHGDGNQLEKVLKKLCPSPHTHQEVVLENAQQVLDESDALNDVEEITEDVGPKTVEPPGKRARKAVMSLLQILSLISVEFRLRDYFRVKTYLAQRKTSMTVKAYQFLSNTMDAWAWLATISPGETYLADCLRQNYGEESSTILCESATAKKVMKFLEECGTLLTTSGSAEQKTKASSLLQPTTSLPSSTSTSSTTAAGLIPPADVPVPKSTSEAASGIGNLLDQIVWDEGIGLPSSSIYIEQRDAYYTLRSASMCGKYQVGLTISDTSRMKKLKKREQWRAAHLRGKVYVSDERHRIYTLAMELAQAMIAHMKNESDVEADRQPKS